MATISNAVQSDSIASTVGYAVEVSENNVTAANLPQYIGVVAEIADTKTDFTKLEFTNSDEVGDKYGYGSIAHIMANSLRPKNSDRLGNIKTVIFPMRKASGATAKIYSIEAAEVAAADDSVDVIINDKTTWNGSAITALIESGDTKAEIATKIVDAVNANIYCPFTAEVSTNAAVLTAKWSGISSKSLHLDFVGTSELNLVVTTTEAGAGIGDITDVFAMIGEEWVTALVTPYNINDNATTLRAIETWIGSPLERTGRYAADVWKPLVCYVGIGRWDTTIAYDFTTLSKSKDALVICAIEQNFTLPGVLACAFVEKYIFTCNENPEIGLEGLYLRTDIISPPYQAETYFNDPKKREIAVRNGVSCATYIEGMGYNVTDFVTTWHPTNEDPKMYSFSRVRYLMIDFNIRYVYMVKEAEKVLGKVILPSGQPTSKSNIIRTTTWIGQVFKMIDEFANRAWIVDADFAKGTVKCQVGASNPNRFETVFEYKRSGTALVVSTNVSVGFYTSN